MKEFVWGLELLRKGVRKNLGNGKSINLLNDPWLPRPMLFKVMSPCLNSNVVLVVEFVIPSEQWDIPKLCQLFLLKEDVDP